MRWPRTVTRIETGTHPPRFVADAAKQKGFSGIRYGSPYHVGKNLVAFDWRLPFEAVGEPCKFLLTPEFFKRRSERLLNRGLPPRDPRLAVGPSRTRKGSRP